MASVTDIKTAYGTYLAYDDLDSLHRVIEFITDGNPKTLDRSLDILESKVWYVSDDEIKKVDRDMIKLILRKFSVNGYQQTNIYSVTYIVPIDYEQWIEFIVHNGHTLSDTVKQTILENPYLLKYIENLIKRCQSDPTILNHS